MTTKIEAHIPSDSLWSDAVELTELLAKEVPEVELLWDLVPREHGPGLKLIPTWKAPRSNFKARAWGEGRIFNFQEVLASLLSFTVNHVGSEAFLELLRRVTDLDSRELTLEHRFISPGVVVRSKSLKVTVQFDYEEPTTDDIHELLALIQTMFPETSFLDNLNP